MMLCCEGRGLRVQRRTVRITPGPGLRSGLNQEDPLFLRSKVPGPAQSTVPVLFVAQVRSVVLVLVLLGSQLVPAQGILTDDQEELLVELHNRYRGLVQPSASAMLPLKWDGGLKIVAEGYAAKCVWNHNPELEETGENLFVGTGDLDLERAVEKWFLERQDYSYHNNSCPEDKMCGHYTQMVWADTHRVGCAVHVCAQMEGLSWTEPTNFLVCNYYPAGNYEGERPYVEGDSCSQCPENLQRCENNLCVSDAESTPADDDDDTATPPEQEQDLPEPTSEEPDQDQDPDQTPDQDPDQTPDQTPEQDPDQTPDQEPDQTPDQDPDQNPDQTPDQDPDQTPDKDPDQTPDKDPGQDPEKTIEEEAVVPPAATEIMPPETTSTAASEEPETRPEPGPEPVPEPGPETPKENPTEGPTGGAVVHTEQEELKIPIGGKSAPPRPQTTPHRPQTTPHRLQTLPPENRGQIQKDSVEKRRRVETAVHSDSCGSSWSWSLGFLWICLLCL